MIALIIQSYKANDWVLDITLPKYVDLCRELGWTLYLVTNSENRFSDVNVLRYSVDNGWRQNVLDALKHIDHEHSVLGFDDLLITDWDAPKIRMTAHTAIEENIDYVRITGRPRSLGGIRDAGSEVPLRQVSDQECYQSSLVLSFFKTGFLREILLTDMNVWEIDRNYAFRSEHRCFSTEKPQIKWLNILFKGDVDKLELMRGGKELRSEVAIKSRGKACSKFFWERHLRKLAIYALNRISPFTLHKVYRWMMRSGREV